MEFRSPAFAESFVPQFVQKGHSASVNSPQPGQRRELVNALPHAPQNRKWSGKSRLHCEQRFIYVLRCCPDAEFGKSIEIPCDRCMFSLRVAHLIIRTGCGSYHWYIRIRVGSGASITSDAYPGRVFRGQVSYVDPTLDPATRTAQIRVELANPGQLLKIGMYVNVAFAALGGSESTVPVVPTSAVQKINNQQVVFVATNDRTVFAMRPLRLGPEANGRYPVLGGVSVGDRIVTEGSFLLRAEWLKLHPAGQ